MRKIVLLFVLLFTISGAYAQQESSDTLKQKKVVYKYLSIQANLLLQQFISFNSNSSINTNPYIFSYSKNNIQTGKGTIFGTGFNISENSSNDGVSATNIQNANLAFRFGWERKYLQQEKFIPFWGIDIGFGGTYNKVTSQLIQSFGSSAITTQTTKVFIGPAFRGGLLYSLSKHILIGTEFFFNAQVAYSETNNGFGGIGQSFIPINIGFQAPTALFLIFKY